MNTKATLPAMSLTELMEQFPTEDSCKEYLVGMRWPNGVRCPRCDNEKVYKVARPWRWICKKCQKNGYGFSPITGTIFEDTKYPLRTWFQVAYLMTQSKKGMSALQIHRMIRSGSYKTAWYMCHRIRSAMTDPTLPKLMGEVEVDETYIGGKAKNRHGGGIGRGKRKHEGGRGPVGKITVVGAIARKGSVVAQVVESADAPTLQKFMDRMVSKKVSLVATDEHKGYAHIDPFYPHKTVNHQVHEYVRGNVHTNTIESFWSLIKRGVVGTYHKVSKDYLPLYLNEFAFRSNNRNNPNIFETVIAGC